MTDGSGSGGATDPAGGEVDRSLEACRRRLAGYRGILSVLSKEELAALLEDDGSPEICGDVTRPLPGTRPRGR